MTWGEAIIVSGVFCAAAVDSKAVKLCFAIAWLIVAVLKHNGVTP